MCRSQELVRPLPGARCQSLPRVLRTAEVQQTPASSSESKSSLRRCPWLCINKNLRLHPQPLPLRESKLTCFLLLAGSGSASTFHFPVQPQHEQAGMTDPRSPGTPGSCYPQNKALQQGGTEHREGLRDPARQRLQHSLL